MIGTWILQVGYSKDIEIESEDLVGLLHFILNVCHLGLFYLQKKTKVIYRRHSVRSGVSFFRGAYEWFLLVLTQTVLHLNSQKYKVTRKVTFILIQCN